MSKSYALRDDNDRLEERCNASPIDLVEAEIPSLRRYARSLTRDGEKADDLVQDCLVRAIENIDKWQAGTSMRAWLLVMMRNLFYNKMRRAKREREAVSELQVKGRAVSQPQQEHSFALQELGAAFNLLSDDHREVLSLVVLQGLEYDAAAQVLGVKVGTIKSRLSRARQILARHTSL